MIQIDIWNEWKRSFLLNSKITQNNLSMKLFSDLKRTKISSSIKEIEKKISKNKATSIYIEDMSNPIYEINSKYIQASIDRSGADTFHLAMDLIMKFKIKSMIMDFIFI